MPRKATTQPSPDEVIEGKDVTIEIRGTNSQLIKRGGDKEFLASETKNQILLGLIDDLQSGEPDRVKRAQKALKNNSALARLN
jgi:hypothetical protein